jgi:hypothetical protein
MSRLIAIAILFVSVSAAAQTLTVAPPSLNTNTRVKVTYHGNTCMPFDRLVRNGAAFDVQYHVEPACTATGLATRDLDLGFLDAGDYSVRAIDASKSAPLVTETVAFAVAQAPAIAPKLDARGIAILLLAIGISASLAMRRAVA